MTSKELETLLDKHLPRFFFLNSDGREYVRDSHMLMGHGDTNARVSYSEFDDKSGKRLPPGYFLDFIDHPKAAISKMCDALKKLDYQEVDGLFTKPEKFTRDLIALLNRYSKENESNTPDYILAAHLEMCLRTFNVSVNNRKKWFEEQ